MITTWDGKPQYMDYHGSTIEVFKIGALAIALNRKPGTIRSMVTKGVLCHPRLRNRAGQWLYTRDQIADLVALAEDEGVISPEYRRKYSQRFITQAQQILYRLPT